MDVPRNRVQKEQVKVRWWWRWHAKEARVGKRTEPVVRRHLAAPYIFLSLSRFLPPDRNDRLSLSRCSPLLWISTVFSESLYGCFLMQTPCAGARDSCAIRHLSCSTILVSNVQRTPVGIATVRFRPINLHSVYEELLAASEVPGYLARRSREEK